jgi:hypothetical protein
MVTYSRDIEWSQIICDICHNPGQYVSVAVQHKPNGKITNYCMMDFKASEDASTRDIVCLLCHRPAKKFKFIQERPTAKPQKYTLIICIPCFEDEKKAGRAIEGIPTTYAVGDNNVNKAYKEEAIELEDEDE